jgi:hypothetical protein
MIKNRFKKTYIINSKKSIYEIFEEIEFKIERQKKNKVLFITEPINYNNLLLYENRIEINRNSIFQNPLKGLGSITFDLVPDEIGTKIKCTIDPGYETTLMGFASLSITPIIISFILLFITKPFHFGVLIFLAIVWLVVIGIGYLSFHFNRNNLENYSDTILYDLAILKPIDDKTEINA